MAGSRFDPRSIVGAWTTRARQRQLNIHIDPEHLGGVYANFANISFSHYEFTITFARIDHEVEEGDVPGVVVSRVNMSTRFMQELLDAMQDSWSKWTSSEGIRNLPETPRRGGDAEHSSAAPLHASRHRDPLHRPSGGVVEEEVRRRSAGSGRARLVTARTSCEAAPRVRHRGRGVVSSAIQSASAS